MLRTCAQVATENMEGTKMLGTVYIKRDSYIQWVCAKHATYLIIIRYVSS